MKQLTLVDKHNRGKLSEGRTYGFGGGFAKVNKKAGKVEMVMPLTACGDFYAEVVHTEHTGKNWSIYGFRYKKHNLFDRRSGVAHIVNGILPVNKGDKHNTFDKESEALAKNIGAIQSFLNWFEERFGVKNKTQITKIQDNRYLFTFDLWWTEGTYRISLYKNLCRIAIYYDGKKTPLDYLNGLQGQETYDWNGMKLKVMDMLSGFIPEQKMSPKDDCPHHMGIQRFPWPRPLNPAKKV